LAVRLDLVAIRDALHSVQTAYPRINERLDAQRPPLLDEIVDNLIAGYALIDRFVADGVDLTAPGHSQGVLEVNHTVLYGPPDARSDNQLASLDASESYFYTKAESGIGDLIEYFAEQRFDDEWQEAAGIYVRMMATPQLFIEGNHRTGALLMSYLLMRRGRPPFVLTAENAYSYFTFSALLKGLKRRSLMMLWRRGGFQRDMVGLLQQESDQCFLVDGKAAAAST
jgi:hypothetical protein